MSTKKKQLSHYHTKANTISKNINNKYEKSFEKLNTQLSNDLEYFLKNEDASTEAHDFMSLTASRVAVVKKEVESALKTLKDAAALIDKDLANDKFIQPSETSENKTTQPRTKPITITNVTPK